MHYFLRNPGMNIKMLHFSIRLIIVPSRTRVQRKCDVSFLHSWLWTPEGFGSEYPQVFRFPSTHRCLGLKAYLLVFLRYIYTNEHDKNFFNQYNSSSICTTTFNQSFKLQIVWFIENPCEADFMPFSQGLKPVCHFKKDLAFFSENWDLKANAQCAVKLK